MRNYFYEAELLFFSFCHQSVVFVLFLSAIPMTIISAEIIGASMPYIIHTGSEISKKPCAYREINMADRKPIPMPLITRPIAIHVRLSYIKRAR